MTALYQTVHKALQWNTLECVLYQGLFVAHQILLYSVATPSLYGQIGTLFSLIYLFIFLSNAGLDSSLAPFFLYSARSQQAFKKIMFPQLIGNFVLMTMLSIMALLGRSYVTSIDLSPLMLGVLCALAYTESCKRTARVLLHLAFLNKQTTLYEIIGIATYIALVWLWYMISGTLTFLTLFVPLLFVSASTTFFLVVLIYNWYRQLPKSCEQEQSFPRARLIKSRLLTSIHSLSHSIFSSNFLVPFCASHFGFVHAGSLNFINTIAATSTALVKRIFGFSFDALFARITLTKDEAAEQEAFSLATENMHHALYGILLFLAINHRKIFALANHADSLLITSSSAFIFFALLLSEYLFMAYERFYIAKERADVLVFIQGATSVIAYGMLTFCSWTHMTYLLSSLLTIRLLSCLFLVHISFHQWHIIPSLKLRPTYLLTALSIALIFFVCT